ncbi:flagellar basal body rod protein FlgB [Helicovermis profundi]|uniref:Flagellar basal body rod protein FlgB n=1 Tax=Helicovermis profundi TaxID=3065157 RepID=A0AAU9E5N5_9FIRM|nr:flagellar basal body rod protein FlgB [Clostridia bacterium S502]
MIKTSFNNIDFLKKAMDGSWKKNQAISNNIANVNTPGYKRETVDFESVLRDQMKINNGVSMKTTNNAHINTYNSFEPTIEKDRNTSFRKDNNNVDIDTEMSAYSKNIMQYDFLTRQISDQLRRIKIAIKEGR